MPIWFIYIYIYSMFLSIHESFPCFAGKLNSFLCRDARCHWLLGSPAMHQRRRYQLVVWYGGFGTGLWLMSSGAFEDSRWAWGWAAGDLKIADLLLRFCGLGADEIWYWHLMRALDMTWNRGRRNAGGFEPSCWSIYLRVTALSDM